MTDCKCVCVKKRKKKKTMPKPVKQQALIDRYNSQTPLINLPAYQTTFREPMKRKKYSVYKAPIIEVVREIPLDNSRIEQAKLRRESAEKRLLANIEKIPTPKPEKNTQEKSTQIGFDTFYRRPPNLPPPDRMTKFKDQLEMIGEDKPSNRLKEYRNLNVMTGEEAKLFESKAQEFIAKTKRPSLTPVDNDPLMGTPPGSPTPAPPFLGRTRSPRPLQADPTMNQPVQRFPTASRTLFADTGSGAGAGVFPK